MSITENQVVSIEYEVKEAGSNEIIDTNVGGEPLSFIVGQGQIIPGLEKGIMSMAQGDRGEILVAAADAYGEYDENGIQRLPKEQFAGIDLNVGMTLYGQGTQGESVQVVVKDFDEESVTIDFNHPLAGKELLFNVSILEVREPTNEELTCQNLASEDSCGCGCESC